MEQPEQTNPPEFKSPIKDQVNIREGGFSHFEARLEPVNDPDLRVEWLKDGRPVEASEFFHCNFNPFNQSILIIASFLIIIISFQVRESRHFSTSVMSH